VINNTEVVEIRPVTYSFCNVLGIRDVRRLISATVFRQMSQTMCDILQIGGITPLSIKTYQFYVLGGVVAYLMIACFGELIFGNKRKFFTLFVWVTLTILFQLVMLVTSFVIKIEDNLWSEAVSGFLNEATMFYSWFLAPIMIAYSNRATQVLTPAATIITLTITVSNMVDYIFTGMIVGSIDHLTPNDSIRRIPPLIALIISWFVLKPAAR
jgi:hypothetical protein